MQDRTRLRNMCIYFRLNHIPHNFVWKECGTYAFSEAFLAVFDRLPYIVTAVSRQRVVQISKRKTINNNIINVEMYSI